MATIVPASVEMVSVGTPVEPGGQYQIVSNSIANPTVVTTAAPHNLQTGDQIYWTASTTSSPLLTATPLNTVTRISDTTFSVPINVTVAGTAGAYAHAVLTIPITAAGEAPLVTCGRAHGLRVGDTVTFAGGNATPDLDGVQTVREIVSTTSFRVGSGSAPTTVAATVPGYFTKTTFYSDIIDRGKRAGGGAVVINSVIGTAPNTVTVNIQGSADGTNWFNVPYALVGTPRTFVLTALTITTSTTTTYLLQEAVFWRYLRLAMSSSTNVRLNLSAYIGS